MFKLVFEYKPSGNQPEAIHQLVSNIQKEEKHQVLLETINTRKNINYCECDSNKLNNMK